MKWIKAFGGLMILAFLGAVGSPVLAEDGFGDKSDDLIKSRTYIGGLGISSNIDQWGDFNGVNYLQFGPTTISAGSTQVSNPEIDFIPAITRNFGWGAMAGHREGPWAAEISFWRSEHNAVYYTSGGSVTISDPASLQSVNLDVKRYFLTQIPTQPFLSVGFSLPWLWVRQGSYLYDPTLTTPLANNDLTISGIGLNLAVGMEIYLGDQFSLVGGAGRRWAGFDQVNGATKIPLNQIYFNGNPANVSSLAGDGYNFYIGTTVGFE